MLQILTGDYTDIIIADKKCFLFTGFLERRDISTEVEKVKMSGSAFAIELKDGTEFKVLTDEVPIMWFFAQFMD